MCIRDRDGPTHQPVEQLASLRAIPGLVVLRPADANEVVEAWRVIMQFRHQPVALILTRQNLPTLDRRRYAPAAGLAKGGYVLADADGGKPEVILVATGSEVSLCIAAYEQLKTEGVKARVVSMPSWELFDRQERVYQESVLPPDVIPRISVEQASTLGWRRYVGLRGPVSYTHLDVYKRQLSVIACLTAGIRCRSACRRPIRWLGWPARSSARSANCWRGWTPAARPKHRYCFCRICPASAPRTTTHARSASFTA